MPMENGPSLKTVAGSKVFRKELCLGLDYRSHSSRATGGGDGTVASA